MTSTARLKNMGSRIAAPKPACAPDVMLSSLHARVPPCMRYFRSSNLRMQRRAQISICTAKLLNVNASPLHLSRHGLKHRKNIRAMAGDQFSKLATGFEGAFESVAQADSLTNENMREPLKIIRRALLEADVSLPVARRFVERVGKAATGYKITRGVRADQMLIKIMNDQLRLLMGDAMEPLAERDPDDPDGRPCIILLAGLQGAGKTTAAGKLALFLKAQGRSAMLVACDVYRPAAIDQLVKLGSQVGVPVFSRGTSADPVDIAVDGVAEGRRMGVDTVIIDTAGRLTIDADMMRELRTIAQATVPDDVLLVVDAMTGQEAATVTRTFAGEANVTGAILTKMDGDTRGGAALSVKAVSGKPIKFVGVGEKLEALEPFYPERMATRILGFGDVATLVEKTQAAVRQEDAEAMRKKMLEATFDYNDFLKQSEMLTKVGSVSGFMKMMPGMNKVSAEDMESAEADIASMKAIIMSMSAAERQDPELIASGKYALSRQQRIAKGAGRSVDDVRLLINDHAMMNSRMKQISRLVNGGELARLEAELLKPDPVKGAPVKLLGGEGRARRKKRRTVKESLLEKVDRKQKKNLLSAILGRKKE